MWGAKREHLKMFAQRWYLLDDNTGDPCAWLPPDYIYLCTVSVTRTNYDRRIFSRTCAVWSFWEVKCFCIDKFLLCWNYFFRKPNKTSHHHFFISKINFSFLSLLTSEFLTRWQLAHDTAKFLIGTTKRAREVHWSFISLILILKHF